MTDNPIIVLGVLSDPVLLGLIAMIAGVFQLIGTVILAWMQKSTKVSVDQGNSKLDDAVGKREKIHDLVNSNFSQVSADVKSANDRLVTMQGIVSQLVEKITKTNGGEKNDVAQEVKVVNTTTEPVPTTTTQDGLAAPK